MTEGRHYTIDGQRETATQAKRRVLWVFERSPSFVSMMRDVMMSGGGTRTYVAIRYTVWVCGHHGLAKTSRKEGAFPDRASSVIAEGF